MLNSQVLVEQCKACLGRAKGLKLAPLVTNKSSLCIPCEEFKHLKSIAARARLLQIQIGVDCLCRSRALATKAVQFRLVRLRMWSGITPRFAPRSWDARLGARRAVWLAKQASCNDAVRPNPPVQIGEVISDHILRHLWAHVVPAHAAGYGLAHPWMGIMWAHVPGARGRRNDPRRVASGPFGSVAL